MGDKKDGGPAYPAPNAARLLYGAGREDAYPGMSLRDWFAGQALAGFLASTKHPTFAVDQDAPYFYALADAMLAEREK
jgi:hypothetical protein